MSNKERATVCVLFFLSLTISALADDVSQAPASPSDAIAANQKILAQTPEAVGLFVVQDDGTIRHVQSGMVCPAKFPNVALWHLEVFQSGADKGTDVGCDYGRNNSAGNMIAKLTIFATKSAAPITLDQAFANYRAGFVQTHAEATSIGPALNLNDKDAGTPTALPEWRSEEWSTSLNGQTITDDLIVTVKNGWMLEIRVTYLGAPNKLTVNKGDNPKSIADSFGDRLVGSLAYVQVSRTVGSAP